MVEGVKIEEGDRDRLALLAVTTTGFVVGVGGLLAGPGGLPLSAVWGGLVVLSVVGGIGLGWQVVTERRSPNEAEPAPPPVPDPLRREVVEDRAEGHCEFCRTDSDALDVEHVTPRSDGGANVRTNLIALCPVCQEKVTNDVYDRSELADKVRRREHPEKTML
ncbi:HNH endonuclease [Halovivax cerinus]|uniref:HNH endonuclease n=1 Tax=Halovivax cerinus TaxID=1487865 RepID=A0ABD5NJC2_9EURY|nr:HNH endonuclease signature motif containing protein [Halovivax cerinus]